MSKQLSVRGYVRSAPRDPYAEVRAAKTEQLRRDENAYRLVRHLEGADTATLRKVAALIGWEG